MSVKCFQKKIYGVCGQGLKLGWSCGPSLPKLLSDHQIVLSGGPGIYWKLLTIKKQYFDIS